MACSPSHGDKLKSEASEISNERKSKKQTQALGSNGSNDIGADPFKNLTSTNNKAVSASEKLAMTRGTVRSEPLVSESDAFLVGNLDCIRLTRRTGLIASHVVTRKEDAIARNNVAWLDEYYIANDNLVRMDLLGFIVADDLDKTMFFLLLIRHKLFLLLPVVQRTNEDNNKDISDDSSALSPIHGDLPFGPDRREVQKDAQDKRCYGGNR